MSIIEAKTKSEKSKESHKSTVQTYARYKDSGVEWLDEIPEHWEVKRFKFLAEANKGKLPAKIVSNDESDLPPYMSMEYLRGGMENQWVKDKDALVIDSDEILLLWDGSNSGEFLKSRKGVISSTVAHIIYKGINKKYAWFHSKVLEAELRKNTIGMGIPHVNGRVLNNSSICLPPFPEQTAIANFLDDKTTKIDQAIAIKQQQIALLKERKQILIHKSVTRGLDDTVALKDSGVEWIGEIPEHWNVFRNNTLFTEKNRMGTEGLPLLSVSIHTAVSNEEIDEEDNVRGRVKIEDKSKYKTVKPKDVVYNMMRAWQGAIGAVSVIGLVSPAYVVAEPKRDIDSAYFECLFRTSIFIDQMNKVSRGITDFRKRLYWNEFRNLMVIVPPLLEQKQISDYIVTASQKIDTAIALKQQEIEKLKEYKGSLINSVVTGKVRVC